MKYYGEMRVHGSGPLAGTRFDALAYALAGIEEADPCVQDVNLTASLPQGWIMASMVIDEDTLELAVVKLIATVRAAGLRAASVEDGDGSPRWEFLTDTAALTVQPAR